MRSEFLKLQSFMKMICHALTYWTKSSEDEKISGGQKYHRVDQILWQNHYRYVIRILFRKIAATIPVTSCECERSGSVLKRLNIYLRASMGQERLTSLAMIHINYDQKTDEEKVLEVFCKKQHRVMELDFNS